jgi:hypothetical protein
MTTSDVLRPGAASRTTNAGGAIDETTIDAEIGLLAGAAKLYMRQLLGQGICNRYLSTTS